MSRTSRSIETESRLMAAWDHQWSWELKLLTKIEWYKKQFQYQPFIYIKHCAETTWSTLVLRFLCGELLLQWLLSIFCTCLFSQRGSMTFLIKRIKTIYILKNKRGKKNLRSKAHKGQELNRDESVTNVLGSVKCILQIPTKVYVLPEGPSTHPRLFSQHMEWRNYLSLFIPRCELNNLL